MNKQIEDADARLRAHAPELLAALEAVVKAGGVSFYGFDLAAALRDNQLLAAQIREAIIAATGNARTFSKLEKCDYCDSNLSRNLHLLKRKRVGKNVFCSAFCADAHAEVTAASFDWQ